ncbi:MAG: carboxypeptidase regulatory-like domain-containing protein, partial [Anaerolineales bacterium]|nr:carboxypeptidase regulatory-like domain-containing protein [Anaerolineales bacterium]
MRRQENIASTKITLLWRSHRKLVGFFLAALLAVLALIIPAVAYTDEPTAIQGYVYDAGSGVAIADALIEIPALGLSTRSNSRGEFSWSGLSISGDFQAVTVQIQAAGYGNWTLENVRILRAETLILEAELKDTPQTITVPPPSNER